jgi:ubiquinone/menaquinone biosynthesis C-methylase UbiE
LDLRRFSQCVSKDASILDFGCGYGRLCAELADAGYQRVQGIDFSHEMIRAARARHPLLQFTHDDAQRLPFGDASFDAVLLFAVLTCIASDTAQKVLIAELARVMKPGSLLVVSDYALQNDERNRLRYVEHESVCGGYGTFRLGDGGIVRHHTQAWLRELLAAFVIEDQFEISAVTMNGNPATITQIWARLPTHAR